MQTIENSLFDRRWNNLWSFHVNKSTSRKFFLVKTMKQQKKPSLCANFKLQSCWKITNRRIRELCANYIKIKTSLQNDSTIDLFDSSKSINQSTQWVCYKTINSYDFFAFSNVNSAINNRFATKTVNQSTFFTVWAFVTKTSKWFLQYCIFLLSVETSLCWKEK